MLGWISLVLGIVIITITVVAMRAYWLSLQRIKKKHAVEFDDESLNQIIARLVYLETELNDINEAYYNIVADLEGKYSIHEKEISIVAERLTNIECALNERVKSSSLVQPQNQNPYEVSQPTILEQDEEEKSQNTKTDSINYANKKIQRAKELKREGLDIVDIAKELNAGITETKMLLRMEQ